MPEKKVLVEKQGLNRLLPFFWMFLEVGNARKSLNLQQITETYVLPKCLSTSPKTMISFKFYDLTFYDSLNR